MFEKGVNATREKENEGGGGRDREQTRKREQEGCSSQREADVGKEEEGRLKQEHAENRERPEKHRTEVFGSYCQMSSPFKCVSSMKRESRGRGEGGREGERGGKVK